jgi:hypothetical protein
MTDSINIKKPSGMPPGRGSLINMEHATMTITKTRRAVLAGAAALPALAAPTALASISPTDPIFAAIERHRAAQATFFAACKLDDPTDEQVDPLCTAAHLSIAPLVLTTPTTVAGCAAMLRYIDRIVAENEQGGLFEGYPASEGPARDVLSRIASTLERAAVRS